MVMGMKLINKTLPFMNKKSSLLRFVTGFVKALAIVLIICIVYSVTAQKSIADNVVRLHIVADSDSEKDQELKLKVRDAILAHIRDEYPDGATREETAQYLKDNLDKIEKIAKKVLKENDSNDNVVAKYGVFPFPTKGYEGLTLPAGMYEAVRVEIGQAKGQNWWCVMFPPLCVADANSLRIDEQAMSQLKEELGPENYSLITDIADRSNVEVKIKFRIIEIFQNSRIKLAEIMRHLF